MKKYILIIIALIAVLQLNAQYTIHINTGGNHIDLPYSNQYDYNWCTVIYPQDKINLIGNISKISYLLNSEAGYGEASPNQKVYMAHTSDIEFTDGNYPDIASMTLVYDGDGHYKDWHLDTTEITLTTPFTYNNTDNLIVHIENHDGIKNPYPAQCFYDYSGTTTYYPCKYKQQDGSFPATTGIRTHELPNIFLTFDPGVDAGVSKINNTFDFLLPGSHDVTVNFSNYMTDTITSVDIEWKVNGTPQTTHNWTGSLNSGQESESINIGSYNFTEGNDTIKVWTVNPNGGTDEDNTNDTLEIIVSFHNPIYVDKDASGANDGSSWTDAYDSLQTALNAASANRIIWVAEGIYKPTSSNDRTISFELPDSVRIYGGFAGTESNIYERDIETYPSILSGEIGIDSLASDNLIHVVLGANYSRINGFTITGGYADSTCTMCNLGGGMLVNGKTDVEISHCTFENNYNSDGGGALENYVCSNSVIIDSCIFKNNTTNTNGGAISNHNTPTEISGCIFINNSALERGGAIFNWGGSLVTITNCTFYNNSSSSGSVIHNWGTNIVQVKNTIFYNNESTDIAVSHFGVLSDIDISYSRIVQSDFLGNNNITNYPLFVDTSNFNLNLMGGSPCIDTGDPSSPLDPNGTRADMGALHFDLKLDVGITQLYSPESVFNVGNQNIIVVLTNFGENTITSVDISCEIDGNLLTTYNWSGSLPYADTSHIDFGPYDFDFGFHTIKAWTSNPNSSSDELAVDDTLIVEIKACEYLNGTYTIGTSGDFSTITEAVDSLSNICGISGPVTFNIEPGTYNEQIIISEIIGISDSTIITFQSQTGDSTDVILTTDSTDYLFNLNGADYLRFKHLTFTSDSAEKFMVLDSGACNNIFENNQFIDGVYHIFNTSTTITDTNNIINNNLFLNGNTAISFYSANGLFETNNVISSNKFENQTGYSIRNADQENLSITNNNIETTGHGLPIHSSLMKNCFITKNTIISSWAAMEFLGGYETNLIANNFIICESNTSNGYSIRLQIDNTKFYNNTIKSIGAQSCPIIAVWGDNNDFKNNILIHLKAGNIFDMGGDNTSDYNCLFSNGASLAKWEGTECADLAAWQTASGLDLNSVSTLPVFYSETDLHTNSLILDGAGTPLTEITDDIDGELRDDVSPDIGADEFTSTCTGSLAGTYTIGSSGDYATFNKAVTTLFECGVNGSVTFNIEAGTYNEQVLINDFIPGYAETDTIIFQSATGDSTSVILTYKADTLNNYTLKLNGTDRFVFKNITISATDTTYGRAIEIGNGACNNLIQNCIISGDVSDEDNNYQALVYFPADDTSRDTSNIIQGNRFVNGSYGIYLESNSSTIETFNTISDNYFINQSAFGIYASSQKLMVIDNNTIINNNLQKKYYGIQFEEIDSSEISNNKIILNSDNTVYGIHLYYGNHYNLIMNNFISVSSNTLAIGISHLGFYSKIYNNSINIPFGSSSSIAIEFSSSTGNQYENNEIINNILSNNAKGYAFYSHYTEYKLLLSDYNNLYSNGDNIVFWGGSISSNISDWQTVSGFGSNSVSSNPNFVSNTDLHTSNVLFNKAATPLPEVTDDIDGDLRDVTTPDIGADEFTGATFDLGDDTTACVDAEYKIDAGEGFDSYLWSTEADSSYILVDSTGIGYGSEKYFVTVTLGAEQYNDSIIVTFSSPIAVLIDYFCFDENTDSVLVTAGDALYYNWSTGETTQSIWTSLTVSVTVTDANGCEDSDYIYRKWNSCSANFTMPGDTTICNNDSIVIDANYYCSADYEYYSYLWNTGDTTETITVYANDISSEYNEYSVEIINLYDGRICTSYDTVWVYRNSCPANLGMPADTTIYLGETLILDANSTACSADYDNYSYLWSTGETTETITLDATALGIGGATYSVSVTNNSTTSNCITSDMINVSVNSANAIETLVMDDISIYPNPTDGILKLEFSNTIENTWLRIINVTGQVVYSEYLENLTGIKTLDLTGLDKGVYILSIQNKNTILTNKITLY